MGSLRFGRMEVGAKTWQVRPQLCRAGAQPWMALEGHIGINQNLHEQVAAQVNFTYLDPQSNECIPAAAAHNNWQQLGHPVVELTDDRHL